MIDPMERDALIEATHKAVKAMGAVPAYDVQIETQEAGFARVRVTDQAGNLGPVFGFGVKKGAGWEVVSLGTYFEPEFYAQHKIPASVQLK